MATDHKDNNSPEDRKGEPAGKAAGEKEQQKPKQAGEAQSKTPPLLNDPVSSTAGPTKQTHPVGQEKSPKPPRSGIAWLALLLALLAGAGAGYTYWLQQQPQPQTVSAEPAEFQLSEAQQARISALESNNRAMQETLEATQGHLERQQQQMQTLQDRLQGAARQIETMAQVSQRGWLLAEAEYLLRLANQRLAMTHETGSALALLAAADDILVTVAEPGLYPVREALAKEMAALRAVEPVDVEGLYVQLAALGTQAESLQLLNPLSEAAVQSASAGATAETSPQGLFTQALERFASLVTIRHRDEPVLPLLSPQQHYYVQQNLRLMMEQAQLALLQRQQQVYQQSLAKAQDWTKEYFQLNTAAQAMLATLSDLQQVQISPALPDISASLRQLRAYQADAGVQGEARKASADDEALP